MTHTLHRIGNEENLQNDFVVFAMSAKGINEEGSAEPMRKFFSMALEFDPVNAGDMKTGNIFTHTKEDLLECVKDTSIVHVVLTDENKVADLLRKVDDADLGISVVVSGLFDRVKELSEKTGVKQHTIECSGGVWGDTDRLPAPEVMQITTMCGHGMVASRMVEQLARDVRGGKMTAEEASKELAKPCVCGVFNPERASKLIAAVAAKPPSREKAKAVDPGQTVIVE